MAKNRYINTKFWDDPFIVECDPTEKLLFLYLLSNPLTSICGAYEIQIRRIAFDTGIDKDMVTKILSRFEAEGKVIYRHGWIAIRNFIKHQSVNPSVQGGIQRELLSVPEDIKEFLDSLYPACIQPVPSLSENTYNNIKLDKVFIAPTAKEVQAYLDDRSITTFTANQFIDFYTARGWLIGKTKMKDWQAAVRTWESRAKSDPKRHKTTEELYG